MDGVALPTPSQYTAETADIVDSGRNSQGKIISDVIRSDVAKVTAKWNYLTLAEWANICGLCKANFVHNVRFLNQTSGAYETRQLYQGDRKAGELFCKDGVPTGWKDCKLALVEV